MENNQRLRSKSQTKIHSNSEREELPINNLKRVNCFLWLKHRRLYTYEQVPKHLQTNSFIRNGYRHDLSWLECIGSFFLFHNETLNIWTHFIGFVLFISYLFQEFIFPKHNNNLFSSGNIDDYFMLLFYVISIIYCMMSSTIFHLFSGCSAKTYTTCLKLDFLGISLATLASFFIGLHLIFKCHLYTRIFYQLIIIILIMIVIMYHILKSDDTIDSTGFIAITLSGFIPVFHWIYVNGYNTNVLYFFGNIIIFFLIFGIGVFFFRTKIPERFAPGRFDYIGASHQLWHIFSLLAFYWWYNHNVELIKYHQTYTCITVFEHLSNKFSF